MRETNESVGEEREKMKMRNIKRERERERVGRQGRNELEERGNK